MGNHEFPCDVCGDNKFGLSGCDETFHSKEELLDAIKRHEKDEYTTKSLKRILENKFGK
jgi:hypothetical protein